MMVRWVVRAGEIGLEETEVEVVAHGPEGREVGEGGGGERGGDGGSRRGWGVEALATEGWW